MQRILPALAAAVLGLSACQSAPLPFMAQRHPAQMQRQMNPLRAQSQLQTRTIPGEHVVKLRAGVSPEDYAARHGLRLVMPVGLNMYVFAGSELQSLQSDPAALWAEPNFSMELPELQARDIPTPLPRLSRPDLPNDPLLPAQYGFEIMGTDKVWQQQPGSSDVIVAVVDSGVDGSHPEFEGQLLPGFDFTLKPPAPGGNVDGYGHGTHVAGVIGALPNNGQGVAGLAAGCKILPVRIFNKWGHSASGRSAAAVIWAVDHGAKVINASWGSVANNKSTREAVEYALSKDVVFVAAVGNSGKETPGYPGALEQAIGVAATTSDDRWASFSTFGDWVDVAAPGKAVLSTYPLEKGNGYKLLEGTSMAAPHVAAAAALVRSQYPHWNAAQVRAQLERTARDVISKGVDKYSGYGRVDVARAVLEAPAS